MTAPTHPIVRDTEEREITKLQHALMRALPVVIVGDTKWNALAARKLAVELYRERVRAA